MEVSATSINATTEGSVANSDLPAYLKRDFVHLTSEQIDIATVVDLSRDSTAGAISTFIGTTRDTFEGFL